MIDSETYKEIEIMFNQELEFLRKRFYPYKRKPFLRNKVVLKIHKRRTSYDKLRKYRTLLGYYEHKEAKKWHCIHIIHITKYSASMYKIYRKTFMKKVGKERLRDTIRHELIHAFVYEEFDMWNFENIENINADYSPIFLSCLWWGNSTSGYEQSEKFKDTELYKRLIRCKSYDQIQSLLINEVCNYERTLKRVKGNNELTLAFGSEGIGLNNKLCIESEIVCKINNSLAKVNIYSIVLKAGFMCSPGRLKEELNNKINRRAEAETYMKVKKYANENCNKVLREITIEKRGVNI